MGHRGLFRRTLSLLGLVLSVLILTMAMLTFVQAKGSSVSITIVKEADRTVVSGAMVTFAIAVTNTGDVTLTDVTVSDALVPNCNRPIGSLPELAPGVGTRYECVRTLPATADFTNSATVTGTDTVLATVVASTAEVFVHVITPAIEMSKSADPMVVTVGDTVHYAITLENTGDSDLTNVDVDDHLVGCTLGDPDGDDGDLVLETDETWTYNCSVTAGSEDIVNEATVRADHEAGGAVTDSAQAEVDVIHPAIAVAKTADPTVVNIDDTVNYTITVENTGDVDLTEVSVDDGLAGCTLTGPMGDDGDDLRLAQDEIWTYVCSVTAGSEDIVNTVTVTATDPTNGTVTGSAQAEVDVIHPAIAIAKMPHTQTVASGSIVNFTIIVTNTGDVPLKAVTVSDPRVSDCSADLGALAARHSTSYLCSTDDYIIDGFINSAMVTGTSQQASMDVTDADAALVRLEETQTCPAGMLAYWNLDETGGPLYDDFYYGHDGECAGYCPTPSTGQIDRGQAFDGGDGIDVPVVPGDDSFSWGADDSFSIEFWMKADSAHSCSLSNEVIVGRDDYPNNQLHWWVGVGCWVGGKAAFVLRDNDGNLGAVVGTTDLADGSWNHVVAVRDASTNENRIYVNGVPEGVVSPSYSSSGFGSPTAALNIGWLDREGSHGYHFNGTVDEVAVYDRALSPDEIRQYHNEGLAERWYCQTGAYKPVIVSPPVTEATVGRPYVYDVDAVGDPPPMYALVISPSGMTIDPVTGLISWEPTVAQEGIHNVEVQASNSEGSASQSFSVDVQAGTICPAGMIAYWKLDETSEPYDDFYDGHDGTCVAQCPEPATGYVNGGQVFDSSRDTKVNVPADPAFDWGRTDSFSIEFWMKADGASSCSASNEIVVGRNDSANPGNELHWWVGVGCWVGGRAAFVLRNSGGDIGVVTGTTVLTDTYWYHVVAVRDGSAGENRIYVNGTEEGSKPASYSAGFGSPATALNIGWLDYGSQDYHFNGTVDEVAVYNVALSEDEIERHYNQGEPSPGYCINPDIAVEKTANPEVVYAWDNMVIYNYTVTNPGDDPLSAIDLSDDRCSQVDFVGGDDSDGKLDPVETWTYRCAMYPDTDITNTVAVIGTYSLGGTVSDLDTAFVDVISPGIAIDKTVDPANIYSGDIVTYTYTVTNIGDDPLSAVQLSDDRCSQMMSVGGDDNDNYRLDLDETWTYTCSTALDSDTINTAIVTGTDSAGGTVSAQDTAFVNVRDDLTLIIYKEANDDDTAFEFAITYGTNTESFELRNGGWAQFSDLAPGVYTITETVASGWEVLGIACTNGISLTAPVTPGVTIDLRSEEDVSCTFTNYKQPYVFLPIILKK
jgi:uncharacterized repeat protein (TIGR01451 family)